MPGYKELVRDSFTKSFTSYSLFLLLAATGIVMSAATYVLEMEVDLELSVVLGATLVMFMAVFANLFATVAAVKYYLNDGTGEISTYFKEVLSNGWSYLWVLGLSTFVMLSGFILFIIPGIILSTYLMFALHTRAAESATGMNALTRSTELVRGHWWDVTLRMFVLTIAIVVVFFGAGFVLGLIALATGLSEANSDAASLLLIEPVASALGTIISLYALTVLYKFLVAEKVGAVSESSSLRSWYIALAVFTPFLVAVVLTLITVGFINEYDFINPEFEEQLRLEMDASV